MAPCGTHRRVSFPGVMCRLRAATEDRATSPSKDWCWDIWPFLLTLHVPQLPEIAYESHPLWWMARPVPGRGLSHPPEPWDTRSHATGRCPGRCSAEGQVKVLWTSWVLLSHIPKQQGRNAGGKSRYLQVTESAPLSTEDSCTKSLLAPWPTLFDFH